MIICDLGLIDFHEAFAIQEKLAEAVALGEEETLLLLEHPPVYTMGSGGKEENILDPSIYAVRTNRGGDVTFHGPGQLVGYPVIDLARRGRDLHRYLRFLEELIIRVAADFHVAALRVAGRTGVWTGCPLSPAKLASIGVGVRRWVTMHGFALNAVNDTMPFRRINPCGITDCPITSLAMESDGEISMDNVKEGVASRFDLLLNEMLPIRE
ncbi:MAG TPA: lipoyl(octanoyl) transferase LipB [Desulfuromonadaceae bacterium]